MKDYKKKTLGKETVIVALICLICLSAIAVGNHFLGKNNSNDKNNKENIINLNSEKTEKESSKEENLQVDGNVVNEKETKKDVNKEETKKVVNEKVTKEAVIKKDEEKTQDKNDYLKQEKANVESISNDMSDDKNTDKTINKKTDIEVNVTTSTITFGEDDKIEWPVKGNVLLDYSMENTIYFPTLDTYKCNPALIIQSEKGTEVKAGVKGIVKNISTEDEIGNYVVVEIGSGYEITYGQLSDIKVQVGNEVGVDKVIGLIADTTRYYENEGTNLYFKMTKNGEPCDPMDYLE